MDADEILNEALPDEPPSDEEIAALEPRSDEYEAAVRRKYGYTSSETRTEAERNAAAARMLLKASSGSSLPPDIEVVWGKGRLNAQGQLAEKTARSLIAAWGIERFRASQAHQAAVKETRRPVGHDKPDDFRK